jgi:hypothetical protein
MKLSLFSPDRKESFTVVIGPLRVKERYDEVLKKAREKLK